MGRLRRFWISFLEAPLLMQVQIVLAIIALVFCSAMLIIQLIIWFGGR